MSCHFRENNNSGLASAIFDMYKDKAFADDETYIKTFSNTN